MDFMRREWIGARKRWTTCKEKGSGPKKDGLHAKRKDRRLKKMDQIDSMCSHDSVGNFSTRMLLRQKADCRQRAIIINFAQS